MPTAMAAPPTSKSTSAEDDAALRTAKAALRKTAIAKRRAWVGDRSDAARDAARHFLARVPLMPGTTVSGYIAMADELDPAPLLARLAEAGHPIALPVVVSPGQALIFRRWRAGDPLEAGPRGTRHPPPSAETARPEVLIVPLLAFDGMGRRLGFGAGYYDRALLKLRASGPTLAAGFAFADQRVAEVPAGASDQRLDWIVTEQGAEALR